MHLIVKHFGYTHHGIYAGRGRVIHYSGFAHLFKKHPIEMTSLKNFSHGKKISVRHYEAPKYSGRTVVRRMRSRMHENQYHLIINNCEHLCSWAITGVERPASGEDDESSDNYRLCQFNHELYEQHDDYRGYHILCASIVYQEKLRDKAKCRFLLISSINRKKK